MELILPSKKRKNIKIFACIGSVGAGFNFCCTHIETPIATGHAPITKNDGTSYGSNPNKLNIRCWIFETNLVSIHKKAFVSFQ